MEASHPSAPPYPAKAVANLLLDWAEQMCADITPLKMQKLLYFVHADYLIRTKLPLVKETFEAWSYGPVIPSVYEEFKVFSREKITSRALIFNPKTRSKTTTDLILLSDDEIILREVFGLYIGVDAGLLSALSHRPGGPWDQALKKFNAHQNINRSISNELIRSAHRLASA